MDESKCKGTGLRRKILVAKENVYGQTRASMQQHYYYYYKYNIIIITTVKALIATTLLVSDQH